MLKWLCTARGSSYVYKGDVNLNKNKLSTIKDIILGMLMLVVLGYVTIRILKLLLGYGESF